MTPNFSLGEGGPTYKLMVRLGLPTHPARAWLLGLALWIPIILGELVRLVAGHAADRTIFDISVHARLLFGLPMLIASERLLGQATTSAVTSLYEGRFCDAAALDRILDQARKLRDWWLPELLLLVLAIAGGQLALWQVAGATGWFHGGEHVGFLSFPRLWYGTIALPLTQFVMYRWLWRWAIWSYVLLRISRLPLATLATHADHAAGLSPLARPVAAFSGFVLATGSVLAGAWATRVIEHAAVIRWLLPDLLAFLLGVAALALGPLLAFCGHLYRARRKGLADYGEFMRDYTLRFHEKWIARSSGDVAIGSPDIQSLADLGNAFDAVSKTRLFVFGPRNVFNLWLSALLPAIPLFARTLTVEAALRRVVSTILGGLPI